MTLKLSFTSEQKWVIGGLSVALAAAAPAFFMKSDGGHGAKAGPVEVIETKGEAVQILESQWTPRSMSGEEQKNLEELMKIDINHADKEHLGTLPNVGEGSASRIIEYREAHGCFRDVDELQEVRGFGGKSKFEGIKDHIRVDLTGCEFKSPPDEDGDPPARKRSRRGSDSPDAADGGLVNINTATLSELDALPGVGKTTAQKIIDYRNDNGSFGSVDDLMNVPGIKEGTFNKFKDLVTTN